MIPIFFKKDEGWVFKIFLKLISDFEEDKTRQIEK